MGRVRQTSSAFLAVEVGIMSPQKIFLRPEQGHPSSLWPSKGLITAEENKRAFCLPEDIGIKPVLGEEILEWTSEFQQNFLDSPDSFHQRPRWKDQFNRFQWYDTGWNITYALRKFFPSVQIVPQFSQFVLSVNERRENFGKEPLCLPGENLVGHVDIRSFSGSV